MRPRPPPEVVWAIGFKCVSNAFRRAFTPGPSSAPTKRCKTFIKRKRWCVEHSVLMPQVLQLWQLRRPFFVLFEEFSKHVEIGINTCLILQNTLDVTVTALAVQNKREHPNRVKGFVETVVPNYCDPTFASHFRMKRQTFQMKDYITFTFMHLAEAFIQSDLHCIQVTVLHFISSCFPWEIIHRIIHFLPPRLLLSIWPYYFFCEY